MFTPFLAYEMIKKRFPNSIINEFSETPEYYIWSTAPGIHDDRWKMDKITGVMEEFDFAELMEYLEKHPDYEDFIIEHKVSDLLKAR